MKPVEESSLAHAQMLMDSGQDEACFLTLKEYWLKDETSLESIKLMSRLMSKNGLKELAEHLAKLSTNSDSLESNVQSLFEAGFHFIDQREHALAVMLLKRCSKFLPDEPAISYELGFALLSLGKFAEAIPYFEQVTAHENDFDTWLNLCVCYILSRQIAKAREAHQQMSALIKSPEDQTAYTHQETVLERLETLQEKADLSDLSPLSSLSPRDWLYIQCGTLLLKQPQSLEFDSILDDYAEVASQLLILRDTLKGLGETFAVVEYYSPLSRPLSQALADLMGIACDSYKGPSRTERALLVMAWASDIIGPHASFTNHEQKRTIFAYALTGCAPLPIAPDIAGCLANSCAMPWDEQWQIEEFSDGQPPKVEHSPAHTDNPEEITALIVQKARLLESAASNSEIAKSTEAAINYCLAHRKFFTLGNSVLFPIRSEYTAEFPE